MSQYLTNRGKTASTCNNGETAIYKWHDNNSNNNKVGMVVPNLETSL